MTVRKRAKSWEYDFQIRGVRYRAAVPEARTRQHAVQAETAARQSVFDGRFTKPKGATFLEEFMRDVYLPWARANKRSWKHDEFRGRSLCRYFKGKELRDISPLMIERFKRERLQTRTVRKGFRTPASVNRELQLLSKILSMAVDNNLLDTNPCRRVRKFREQGARERYLTHEEEARLFAALSVPARSHAVPVVRLALQTGMRRGEILALLWRDTDLSASVIRVVESKSGKPRLVPMNEEARRVLLTLRTFSTTPDEPVFTSYRTGLRLTDLRKSFNSACREAEIEDFHFHDLRHTAATRMGEAGVHPVAIRELLGHATLQMTARYAHATPVMLREAADALSTGKDETVKIIRVAGASQKR